MGKRRSGWAAALWIAALCVGCGQSDGAEKAAGDQPLPDSTSLEAIAGVVAAGGSIDYASRPEGGAVLVGAASRDGNGQRFAAAGLVVDVEGNVAVTFELPQATDVRSITVSGGRAVVLGMACDGVSREDDTTGERNCVPGVTVGFEIDTASGTVTPLDLPDEAVERYTATDVIGVGRDGLVLTAQAPDGTFLAWSRGTTEEWRSIEAPEWYPCQVGMSAVVVPPTTDEGEARHTTAALLDFESGRWQDLSSSSLARRSRDHRARRNGHRGTSARTSAVGAPWPDLRVGDHRLPQPVCSRHRTFQAPGLGSLIDMPM